MARASAFFHDTAEYHAFVDYSRRKPYICGVCGRDITHPYHQPRLTGAADYVAPDRTEQEPEELFQAEPEPTQMRLF